MVLYPAFVAVTVTEILFPLSLFWSVYVVPVANVMGLPFRRHCWDVVAPDSQVPTLTVRVFPTLRIPEMDGVAVIAIAAATAGAVVADTTES